MSNKFNVFFEEAAENINTSRLGHLASLGLNLTGKRVLEVGAGVGRLTGFFEALNCSVLSTDGRPENVQQMRLNYPHRQTQVVDLETATDLTYLGIFDVVFCYGTLYHLQDPEHALQVLAPVCRELLLLETCVTPGEELAINLEPEDPDNPNQALSGRGCRPTRPWVMATLQKYFEYVYVTTHQPTFPDFDLDWQSGMPKKLHRAVFVGSRQPLHLDTLLTTLPAQQTYPPQSYQTWIDVGVHPGRSLLGTAVYNLALTVYGFEPNLHVAAEAAGVTPNYIVIPAAVSTQDGLTQMPVKSLDPAGALSSPSDTAEELRREGTALVETVIPVPTVRLDTFLQQQGIAQVDYLKIDAQGADFEVVRSLGSRLTDCHRIQLSLTMSASPGAGVTTRDDVFEYMTQHQFVLIRAVQPSQEQAVNLTFVHRNQLLSTPDVADYLETLQPHEWTQLATAIATFQPIALTPGWHFDVAFNQPELPIRARRKIWEYAKTQPFHPIQFEWDGKLLLQLYLGNDLSRQLYISGTYDPNELYFLSQILTAGMTVVDVGANEGLYSLFAARLVSDTGTVLAFEPSQREFDRLQYNLELNRITNVKPFKLALANDTTSQVLKVAEGEHSGQNTLGDFAYEGVTCVQTETVELRRFDDVVAELGMRQVDVIKMDVEGAEFAVLQGARETIQRCRPLLMMEFVDQALHNQGTSCEAVIQWLQDLGYKLFVFGQQTGIPVQASGRYLNNTNAIAAHPERVWSLLSEQEQMEYLQQELEQTQQALTHTQAQLKQTQADFAAQIHALQKKLDVAESVAAELAVVQVELSQNKEAKEQAQLALEAARNQIAAMESSKFWQFRDRWLNLKRKLKLSAGE